MCSSHRLYEAIRRATDTDSPADLEAQTLGAWLAVHGLATLWLAGNLPYPRDPRVVAEVFADLIPALARIAAAAGEQARRAAPEPAS
jgi:hypothetical protein